MYARHVLVALVLACATLLFGAGQASAVPETPVDSQLDPQAERSPLQKVVERQVRERELALTALLDAADRHAEVEEIRADRLAQLGYAGDLADLEHVLPVHGYRLSAGFGQSGALWASTHTGLDFAAPTGTDLVAVADGTVTEVGDAGAYGLRTVLTLRDGTELWYCHQLASLVVPGQEVEIGEQLGLLGSTGNSTGPHLHFEVRPDGSDPVDPANWLRAAGLTL